MRRRERGREGERGEVARNGVARGGMHAREERERDVEGDAMVASVPSLLSVAGNAMHGTQIRAPRWSDSAQADENLHEPNTTTWFSRDATISLFLFESSVGIL